MNFARDAKSSPEREHVDRTSSETEKVQQRWRVRLCQQDWRNALVTSMVVSLLVVSKTGRTVSPSQGDGGRWKFVIRKL